MDRDCMGSGAGSGFLVFSQEGGIALLDVPVRNEPLALQSPSPLFKVIGRRMREGDAQNLVTGPNWRT